MGRFALMILAVILATPPVSAKCLMSYCKGQATASTPAPGEQRTITNTSRQRLGDLYNPGHGWRIQIRDTSRRIIGYIERDGSITDTHRQRVGTIEGQ